MKKGLLITLAYAAVMMGLVPASHGETPGTLLRQPVDYVDPLLGTANSRWMLTPGPWMPFSMVKISPVNEGWKWKGGYEYGVDDIRGFDHIHSWTMAGLLMMPTTGDLKIHPGKTNNPDAGYRSRIDKETEKAGIGFYEVVLKDYKIKVELTATTRAAMQRYTFPQSDKAWVLIDLNPPAEHNYRNAMVDGKIVRVGKTELEGYSKFKGRGWSKFQDYTVHFVIQFNKPFASLGGWVGDGVKNDVSEITGSGNVGAFVSLKTKEGEAILARSAISLVSIEQARLNLNTEMAKPFGWDFKAVKNHQRKTWNNLLSAILVEGGTEVQKIKFYTNMYRSYCGRTICSDVNGKYVDMYEKVQQLPDPDSPVYGCDAFWNTFWNLNQLWTLAHPDLANKWVKSLLEIYDRGGWLAKGPAGIEYSSIMVASHEIALIVAAYQKGIRNYDVEKAWEAIRHIQTTPGKPHPGGGNVGNMSLSAYLQYGYITPRKGNISTTMEYAYDDWCAAQLAKALGKKKDYGMFMKRAGYWRNIFDRKTGFIWPKLPDGRWLKPFNPYRSGGYVEGNAWQYTWFVPHDVAGLIKLMGKEEFNRRLAEGFEKAGPRFTSKYVNHGNQPNMQAAYLFNYSGMPWLTQKWAREIMARYYGTGPVDGYPGDEDQGQMGAWYVMSAMGIFQMDGGCAVKPIYEIGSPIFDRVVIKLDPKYYKGGQFVIEAKNNSKENMYIQSATLDGKPLNKPWFYHSELADGGKLVLQMGPEPNKKWGSAPEATPPSTWP